MTGHRNREASDQPHHWTPQGGRSRNAGPRRRAQRRDRLRPGRIQVPDCAERSGRRSHSGGKQLHDRDDDSDRRKDMCRNAHRVREAGIGLSVTASYQLGRARVDLESVGRRPVLAATPDAARSHRSAPAVSAAIPRSGSEVRMRRSRCFGAQGLSRREGCRGSGSLGPCG